jgi:divalent metal cation (Fe/Co/Zn/Cd) transporter
VKVEYFSTAWMAVEVIGSIVAGLMAGSFALLAFGGDSVIEFISGLAVLAFLKRKRAGSDGSSLERVTSGLLFALIPVIGLGAVYSYFSGLRAEGSPVGIGIAVGAVIIMPYLWYEKRRMGLETRTLPLTIDAVESLTCLFMSVALLVGLLAVFLFGLWWFDYVATAVILAFVTKEAIESFRELHEEDNI